jgi:hypothetical protein
VSMSRLETNHTSLDDAVVRRVSLWACLLITFAMLLGGHSPPVSSSSPMVLPDSSGISWVVGEDGGVLVREAHVASQFKVPSRGGESLLPAQSYSLDEPVPMGRAPSPLLARAPAQHTIAKPHATGPPRA